MGRLASTKGKKCRPRGFIVSLKLQGFGFISKKKRNKRIKPNKEGQRNSKHLNNSFPFLLSIRYKKKIYELAKKHLEEDNDDEVPDWLPVLILPTLCYLVHVLFLFDHQMLIIVL